MSLYCTFLARCTWRSSELLQSIVFDYWLFFLWLKFFNFCHSMYRMSVNWQSGNIHRVFGCFLVVDLRMLFRLHCLFFFNFSNVFCRCLVPGLRFRHSSLSYFLVSFSLFLRAHVHPISHATHTLFTWTFFFVSRPNPRFLIRMFRFHHLRIYLLLYDLSTEPRWGWNIT